MQKYEFDYESMSVPVSVDYQAGPIRVGRRFWAHCEINPSEVTVNGKPHPKLESLDGVIEFNIPLKDMHDEVPEKVLRKGTRQAVNLVISQAKPR